MNDRGRVYMNGSAASVIENGIHRYVVPKVLIFLFSSGREQKTMTPERYQRLNETLNRRQPDLTLLADEVHKPHNLAAIIRTCDAVGIVEVHFCNPRLHRRQLHTRSMGSDRWVDVQQHNSTMEAAEALRADGFKIYAAHFSDRARPYQEVDYTVPCALLVGAEKYGVAPEMAAMADEHVLIPMQGMVQSFNVSVAAAIILMEAQRQRMAAGLYNTRRLPLERHALLLFRWAYPELARYCDQRGLAYPPLDEHGQLIAPSEWYDRVRTTV